MQPVACYLKNQFLTTFLIALIYQEVYKRDGLSGN